MQFNFTSRKDDLMSVAYLLLTLLNGFYFPGADSDSLDPFDDNRNLQERYIDMMNRKNNNNI